MWMAVKVINSGQRRLLPERGTTEPHRGRHILQRFDGSNQSPVLRERNLTGTNTGGPAVNVKFTRVIETLL